MTQGLGSRLREHRLHQHVSLQTIAAETKISESLLDALERDDVSRWPAGIFRRAFVRAYAKAIRLDPDEVVREFLERHPDPLESVDAVGAVALAAASGETPRGVIPWRRRSGKPPIPTRAAAAPDHATSHAQHVLAVESRPDVEPSLPAAARLCGALACVLRPGDARPLLEQASRVIGAAGLLIWRWEPRRLALRPWIGHGYSDAVIAQLPPVVRDDNNAVASAFRGTGTYVVNGGNEMTGALTVPLLAATGCVGVLALEFRNGGEQRESVRAVAEIIAAQLVHLVADIQ